MNRNLSICPLISIQQVTVNILGSLVPLINFYAELLAKRIICQATPLAARKAGPAGIVWKLNWFNGLKKMATKLARCDPVWLKSLELLKAFQES